MGKNSDFDFNKLIDGFIDTAKNITENIASKGSEFVKESGMQDLKDYYPFYSWPPLNLYTSSDECIIFEFGLPGFVKDDINIEFDEDFMLFSARLSNIYSTGSTTRSFKSKLKLSDISNQKYYLPLDKYNRKNYSMHMKNGLLRLVFNPVIEE